MPCSSRHMPRGSEQTVAEDEEEEKIRLYCKRHGEERGWVACRRRARTDLRLPYHDLCVGMCARKCAFKHIKIHSLVLNQLTDIAQAKVNQHHRSGLLSHQQIGRCQVSMDHIDVMHLSQCVANPHCNPLLCVGGLCFLSDEMVADGCAFNVLHVDQRVVEVDQVDGRGIDQGLLTPV